MHQHGSTRLGLRDAAIGVLVPGPCCITNTPKLVGRRSRARFASLHLGSRCASWRTMIGRIVGGGAALPAMVHRIAMIHSTPRGGSTPRSHLPPHGLLALFCSSLRREAGEVPREARRVGSSASSNAPPRLVRDPTSLFREDYHHPARRDGVRLVLLSTTCLAQLAGHRRGHGLAGGTHIWRRPVVGTIPDGRSSPSNLSHHLPSRRRRSGMPWGGLIAEQPAHRAHRP